MATAAKCEFGAVACGPGAPMRRWLPHGYMYLVEGRDQQAIEAGCGAEKVARLVFYYYYRLVFYCYHL